MCTGGVPANKLKLKVNCVVMFIRNLNNSKAFVNGIHTHECELKFCVGILIDCEVLTGSA